MEGTTKINLRGGAAAAQPSTQTQGSPGGVSSLAAAGLTATAMSASSVDSQLSLHNTMTEEVVVKELKSCCNPGCEQPGTNACSACKTSFYCCVICQTSDWPHHKEECDGHLRKVGNANLAKAKGFCDQENWLKTLHYAEIAATKLKKLKDRRLETVLDINAALENKFDALGRMGRYKELKECAEERYTLWAMNHMRHPGSMRAALALIESCLHNEEFEDAEHYARHAMFMINEMADNFIPSDQRSEFPFLAQASYFLAQAIYALAKSGGIPPERMQNEGEEAIALARQALNLHTHLHGTTESAEVANSMSILADVLAYFNKVDDNEALRLYEQSIAIFSRLQGSLSFNVAVNEGHLGIAYSDRANRAHDVNDLDRCMANFELSLPRFVEAARIYTAINHIDIADKALRQVVRVEENIRRIGIARAAATRK